MAERLEGKERSKRESKKGKKKEESAWETVEKGGRREAKERRKKGKREKKINKKKYRVYAGPFNNINSLQKSFNDISILEFENIEIIKND